MLRIRVSSFPHSLTCCSFRQIPLSVLSWDDLICEHDGTLFSQLQDIEKRGTVLSPGQLSKWASAQASVDANTAPTIPHPTNLCNRSRVAKVCLSPFIHTSFFHTGGNPLLPKISARYQFTSFGNLIGCFRAWAMCFLPYFICLK